MWQLGLGSLTTEAGRRVNAFAAWPNYLIADHDRGDGPNRPRTGIYHDFSSNRRLIASSSDLSDFFDCSGPQCHPFQPITLVNNSQLCNQSLCKSNQCDATCFINYPGDHKDPDTY